MAEEGGWEGEGGDAVPQDFFGEEGIGGNVGVDEVEGCWEGDGRGGEEGALVEGEGVQVLAAGVGEVEVGGAAVEVVGGEGGR